jgi:isochorismate synthase
MRTMPETTTLIVKELDLISILLEFSFDNNYSLAIWQLPGRNSRRAFLSSKPLAIDRETFIEALPSGFVLARFEPGASSLFIPGDIQFTLSDETIQPPSDEKENLSHQWLAQHMETLGNRRAAKFHVKANVDTADTGGNFLSIVKDAIQEIEKGSFEKVVPSRRKVVTLSERFDIAAAFSRLCKAYPQAFVSLVSSPESGTWIGATPEELVRLEDKAIFRTVAVAGTQPYHEGINPRKVAWTHKEIEEQALVERYIISCFKKIRLREYEEHGPKTMVAGNLMHLRSDFTVDLKETNFPQLGSIMLRLLHPTSAVCGMPMEAAYQFLRQREGYDRGFYSGYLGPVNVDNNTDIFVNLRCMQLLPGKGIVYAGAGVTVDSVPEQEWEETEMKMNTLLRVIQ